MKRPIILILTYYILGIIFYEFFALNLNFYIFLSLIFLLFYSKNKKNAILMISIISISIISTQFRYPSNQVKQTKINAEIFRKEVKEFNNHYYLKYKNANILLKTNKDFSLGDIVSFTEKLSTPKTSNNFNTFNMEGYLKSKNVFYEVNSKSVSKIGHQYRLKYNIYNHLKEFFDKNLNNISSAFMNSMILSEKSDNEMFDDFKDLGLSHVLAISGLHLNILILFLDNIGRRMKISKKYFGIFLIMFLIFYGYLVDFPISLIRALSMYSVTMLAIYTNNIKDKYNTLCVSMLVSLIVNPFFIYSTGFYLSYITMFSIYYLPDKVAKLYRKIPKMFITPIAIQIGLIPFSIYFFNKINLLSIFTNILILPFVSVALLSGFIYIFIRLKLVSIFIEGIFYIISLIIYPLNTIKDSFEITFPYSNVKMIVVYYLIIICILNYRMILYKFRKNRKLYLIFTIFPVILLKTFLLPYAVINVIDVGQGDAVMLRNKGITTLIDTGGNMFNPELSGRNLFDYLYKNGVTKIDNVFISHNDFDHMGNLQYLVSVMNVGKIYSNTLKNYNAKSVKNGEKINIGNAKFEVILDGKNAKSSNDSSLVLLLKIFNSKILLTGDVEENEKFIKIGDRIDFLKVSHHGSNHSTSEEFLQNNPNITNALISAGFNNRYGHPHTQLLQRLKKRNIKIFRTDKQGNIEIYINRYGYSIYPYKYKYDVVEFLEKFVLY